MYKKKLAVRVVSAIAIGSLLTSNVTVAMGQVPTLQVVDESGSGIAGEPDTDEVEEKETGEAEAAEETEAVEEKTEEESEAEETGATKESEAEEETKAAEETEVAEEEETEAAEKETEVAEEKTEEAENAEAEEETEAAEEENDTEETEAPEETDGELDYDLIADEVNSKMNTSVLSKTAAVQDLEERTSIVTFNTDPEKGTFEGGITEIKFEDSELSETEYLLPEVEARDGYKFVGWSVNGEKQEVWDADKETFTMEGLCYFYGDSTEGYANISAMFEEITAPENRTVFITFTVDSEKGTFADGNTEAHFDNIDEFSDQQFDIPVVEAKEGYRFVGWSGYGAEAIEWGAEAKTFGVAGLCHFQEDSLEGYASIAAVFEEEPPAPENRTVSVVFTVDPEKGIFDNGTAKASYDNIDEFSDQQFDIPVVTAKEGYRFVGWRGYGAEAIEWDAEAKTFGVAGLCHFAEDSLVGYASIEAVFEEEDPAQENRTVSVVFTADPEKGIFDNGAAEAHYDNIDEFSDQQFDIPVVTAKEGYRFVGWRGYGAGAIEWDAEAKTFGVAGLCHFAEGSLIGYASIEAVFEEEAPAPESRTVSVVFTVDPEKGIFDNGATEAHYDNIDEFSGQQFDVPVVEAKEGYRFVGWRGYGAGAIEWDAEAKTFGVAGLCHFAEGSLIGYASIEAVFEVEAPAPENRTVSVVFTVDPEKGVFDNGATEAHYDNIDEFSDQQFDVPVVEAKEGYRFVGWRGYGAEAIEWDAEAKTFGVTGLCFFPEDSLVGYASIEAVMEKEETPLPELVTITVTYVDSEGNIIGIGKIQVEEGSENFHTGALTDLPDGYEVATVGDIAIQDYTATVVVKKSETVAPEEKAAATLRVSYMYGNDVVGNQVLTSVGIKGETAVFTAEELVLPEGYVIVQAFTEYPVVYGASADVSVVVDVVHLDEQADAVLYVTYKYKNTVKGNQTFTQTGLKGDNYTFNSTNMTLTVPTGYAVDGSVPETVVRFGEEKTIEIGLKLKSAGGSGGSGGSGSSGGSGASVRGMVAGGAWRLNDTGWWYEYTDNSYAKDGWYYLVWQGKTEWYYFDANGYLISGWFTDPEGNKFFLHDQHDGEFGRMYVGWNKVNGEWKYFNEASDGTRGALVEGVEVPAELGE